MLFGFPMTKETKSVRATKENLEQIISGHLHYGWVLTKTENQGKNRYLLIFERDLANVAESSRSAATNKKTKNQNNGVGCLFLVAVVLGVMYLSRPSQNISSASDSSLVNCPSFNKNFYSNERSAVNCGGFDTNRVLN